MASSCCFVLKLLKMRITPATSGSMVIHSTSRSDSEIPYVHHSSRMSSCQEPPGIPYRIALIAKRCSHSLASRCSYFFGSPAETSDLNLQFIVLVFPTCDTLVRP